MVFEINSVENWKKVAQKILPLLKYKILLLKGNLGVGKTTFTKYLLEIMKSKDEITSPTYSLMNGTFFV